MSKIHLDKLSYYLKQLIGYKIVTQITSTGMYCILTKYDIKVNLYYNFIFDSNNKDDSECFCTVFIQGGWKCCHAAHANLPGLAELILFRDQRYPVEGNLYGHDLVRP